MSIPIKNIVHKVLTQNKNDAWKTTLITDWERIIGTLAPHVRLEKINGTTLTLGVYSACWLQELYLLSSMLITTINNQLGAPHVHQLRFKQIAKRVQKKKPESFWNTNTTLRTLTEKEQQTLASITDDSLRESLEKILRKCSS